MIPPKYCSTDRISGGYPWPDPTEAFIDDIHDETWASIRYIPDEGYFSIYVDGRQLGEDCCERLITIHVDAIELQNALDAARELA